MLTVGKLILSELAPVVSAQHGVFYIMESPAKKMRSDEGEKSEAYLKLLASYAFRSRKNVAQQVRPGRRPRRPGRVREGTHPRHERAGGLRADHVRPRPGAADEHHRAAGALRRPGQGRHRTLFVRAVQPDAPGVPRSARGIDRHRVEHDRGEHAHGRSAEAVAIAGERIAKPPGRTAATRTRNCRKKRSCSPNKTPKWNARTTKSNRPARRSKKKPSSLALTSKYKSEFLANMSHELRTPLNSLLILADQLALNTEGNLSPKQIEFCRNHPRLRQRPAHAHQRHSRPLEDRIRHGHGRHRRTALQRFARLRGPHVPPRRRERRVSSSRSNSIRDLPRSMFTDSQRLEQVIRNLLSNAFKFTEKGRSRSACRVGQPSGWSRGSRNAQPARARSLRSRSATPASASRRRNSRSFSRRSNRPMAAPAANTAARALAWRSAAKSRGCSAAKFVWPARRAKAAPSRCICRKATCHGPCRKETTRFAPLPAHDRSRDVTETGDGTSVGTVRAGRSHDRGRSGHDRAGDRVVLIVEDDLHLRQSAA